MSRVTVTLQQNEKTALVALAQLEQRDPRRQAAIIIRHELERRGLLPPAEQQVVQVAAATGGAR